MAATLSQEAQDARAFARRYVALVRALLAEGCDEAVAREEARLAALAELKMKDLDAAKAGPKCPLCGQHGS